MGQMGHSILCTFGEPRILGAIGFTFVSFVLLFFGRMDWKLFVVVLTLFWKDLVGSFFEYCKVVVTDEVLDFVMVVVQV
jgi:hypothetical protein